MFDILEQKILKIIKWSKINWIINIFKIIFFIVGIFLLLDLGLDYLNISGLIFGIIFIILFVILQIISFILNMGIISVSGLIITESSIKYSELKDTLLLSRILSIISLFIFSFIFNIVIYIKTSDILNVQLNSEEAKSQCKLLSEKSENKSITDYETRQKLLFCFDKTNTISDNSNVTSVTSKKLYDKSSYIEYKKLLAKELSKTATVEELNRLQDIKNRFK